MNKFTRERISFNQNNDIDKGVKVSNLISLVQGNEIGNALLNLLNVDSIKNEFIEIPNATALVEFQKKINERFHKEDIESSLEDMSLYSSNSEFSINYNY